jgi:aminobenzoyl-glutamate transport protein
MTSPPAAEQGAPDGRGLTLRGAAAWLAEPVGLFLLALLLVALSSGLGALLGWRVTLPDGSERAVRPLFGAEGGWWFLSHLVENFTRFPPLGVVVVGMLGISLAEQSGLIAALLRHTLRGVAGLWLGPLVLLVAINSSIALDAGYVVVPPLAAALFQAAGRSPLAGLALAHAGVAGGYSANFALTAVDPLLAGYTEAAAGLLAPGHRVAPTCNWWFMAASTVWLTVCGVPALAWLEARLAARPPAGTIRVGPAGDAGELPGRVTRAGDPADPDTRRPREAVALACALGLLLLLLGLITGATLHPEGILAGSGERHARVIEASVPLLALCFGLPALVYGQIAGSLRGLPAIVRALEEGLARLAPWLLVTFFAAQFVAAFSYTGLGEALAMQAGAWLTAQAVPVPVLLLGTVFLVMGLDLLIASASAKYAILAPLLVPALMGAGLSPELAQAAYRVGDSVTNVISPLNPYLVITLGYLRRYAPTGDFALLVRLMLPFVLSFGLAWPALLLVWAMLGIPLGPGGPIAWAPSVTP